jgi:hypothetical protein
MAGADAGAPGICGGSRKDSGANCKWLPDFQLTRVSGICERGPQYPVSGMPSEAFINLL